MAQNLLEKTETFILSPRKSVSPSRDSLSCSEEKRELPYGKVPNGRGEGPLVGLALLQMEKWRAVQEPMTEDKVIIRQLTAGKLN